MSPTANRSVELPATIESRPVPDPTLLTTEQLVTHIQALRELVEARLDGNDKALDIYTETNRRDLMAVQKLLEMRLDASDKARELLAVANQFPTRLDERIAALERIHEEKFRSIATQFIERDARSEQYARDNKIAVDAALQSAKEAVAEQNKSSALAIAKSETATSKQIEQLGAQLGAINHALDGKINDIKERLTRIEGSGIGEGVARRTAQTNTSLVLSVIFGLFSAAAAVTAVVVALNR